MSWLEQTGGLISADPAHCYPSTSPLAQVGLSPLWVEGKERVNWIMSWRTPASLHLGMPFSALCCPGAPEYCGTDLLRAPGLCGLRGRLGLHEGILLVTDGRGEGNRKHQGEPASTELLRKEKEERQFIHKSKPTLTMDSNTLLSAC